jgi:hypothetical protein
VTERLSLWDVDDAVAFTAAIANRSGLNLSWSDREDLEQYLLVEIWRLSLRYERGDPQFPPRFSVYAAPLLALRTVDWIRQRNGRTRWQFAGSTYERKRPRRVPFDDSARDRLDQAHAESDGDREAGGDLSIAGLDSDGDRRRARDYEILGLEPPRRVA